MAEQLVLFGASGQALTAVQLMQRSHQGAPAYEVVALIDEFRGGDGVFEAGIPVVDFEQWRTRLRHLPCIVTVGKPLARRAIVERLTAAGAVFANSHVRIPVDAIECSIGIGGVLHDTASLMARVALGHHVHILPHVVIGHDVRVGDFATIASSATISGHVVVEEDVFIGAGAIITNGTASRPLVIGRGATVGAGAVVTRAVPPGATVMGNPARPLRELARKRPAR